MSNGRFTATGGMGGSAWDSNRNKVIENEDRSRWYGLRPGDIVEMKFGQQVWKAKVVRLHGMDNNGCTLRLSNGKEMKGVCEWCTVVKKVEDQ